MKKIYALLLPGLLITALGQAQTTIVLPATQDNTIYSEATNNSNGAGQNFTAGRTNLGDFRRGLLRFDLSALPAGAFITDVSLRLVVTRVASGAHDILVHQVQQAWGEGASEAVGMASGQGVTAAANDATWACSFANGAGSCNTPWSVAGGLYDASPSAITSVADVGVYTWSGAGLVNDVQQWVNNAGSNFGWLLRTAEVATGTAKRFASRTNATPADQPSLTITYNGTLPVSFGQLQAGAIRQGALLNWKTFQEINNNFFDVEYGTDGINFSVIGRVLGAGNSSRELSYSFIHDKAVPGKNFYRLRQTDFGGRVSYSNIELLLLAAKPGALVVSPNPVTETINLPGVGLQRNPIYSIYNLKGQLLQQSNLTDRFITLAAGMGSAVYHLRIVYADGTALSSNFYKN